MTLKRYLSVLATHFLGWQGRISRGEWWLCWGIDLLLALAFAVARRKSAENTPDFDFLPLAVTGLLLWAATCANIKRFHDRNKPWPWALLAFVPGFGSVWIVVELGFLKGTRGRNAYGDDPLSLLHTAPPPISTQLREARAEILRKLATVRPDKPKAPPARPSPVVRHPLIQYGYKRPERTVTRA